MFLQCQIDQEDFGPFVFRLLQFSDILLVPVVNHSFEVTPKHPHWVEVRTLTGPLQDRADVMLLKRVDHCFLITPSLFGFSWWTDGLKFCRMSSKSLEFIFLSILTWCLDPEAVKPQTMTLPSLYFTVGAGLMLVLCQWFFTHSAVFRLLCALPWSPFLFNIWSVVNL